MHVLVFLKTPAEVLFHDLPVLLDSYPVAHASQVALTVLQPVVIAPLRDLRQWCAAGPLRVVPRTQAASLDLSPATRELA